MNQGAPRDFRTGELLEVLGQYSGRRIFVAALGSPDPDGLASAWLLSILARTVNVRADILTFEVISRPDNIAFVRLLGVPYRQVRDRLPAVNFEAYAVVDRQNARLPIPTRRKLPLLAHIDHHAASKARAMFTQRETSFGSTSSIMAGHFAHLVQDGGMDADEASRVATALMFGIRTDTADFLNASPADFQAAAILEPHVSAELLHAIVLTPLGKPFLATLSQALLTLENRNGLLVAFAGRVGGRARDTLGQTADFLARFEGARVVVTFGIVNDGIVGSLRTSDPDLDPYQFLDSAMSSRIGIPLD